MRWYFAVLVLVLGYLSVAFAATLGAPFWFDLLGKFMVIRSTVKPTEKSPDESSKDGGTGGAPQPQAAEGTGGAGHSPTGRPDADRAIETPQPVIFDETMPLDDRFSITPKYATLGSRRRSGRNIARVRFLVAHDTGNPGASADAHARNYRNNPNPAPDRTSRHICSWTTKRSLKRYRR